LNEQISIVDIVDMLLRRWWLIVVSAITIGVIAFMYTSLFIDPMYRSEGALFVNSTQNQISGEVTTGALAASQKLVTTYAEILQRRTFLEQVVQDLDNKYTVAQIKNMLKMGAANETEILEITVTGKDPHDVYLIARSVLRHAPDELIRVVEAGSVKILDNAKENKTPISPNIRNNTLIGILVGILLGALIAVLLELFDTRIKSGEEISQRYDEPLLGEIPNLETDTHERKGK